MTPERWQQITEIFHGAIAIGDPAARDAYLHDLCSDDPLLRAEIDSLLAAHGDGSVSIDAPRGVAAAEATGGLVAGTMLGPYRVDELLGAGGMGEVYRAHDSRLGRTVAVKILPPHLRASPQLLARFEREARAVGSLNHPYICTLHDIGRERGIDFLVMELIEGETLSNRLRRGRLPVDESVRISGEVAEALAAAHDKGIIHRDIKPSNIILSAGGHVKVVDFGLARTSALFQDDQHAKEMTTQTEVIAGTPRYMSPEQALGQPLDPRTDIFSLGVVLFECLTGELPFAGNTKFEYLQNVLSGKAKSITALRADVPGHLRSVLSRCLERDASKRLDSARWLATELGRIGAGASPPFSRRFVGWTVAAAALVALVASLVVWWTRSPPSAGTEDAQLRRFTTSPGDEFDSHLSPDGMWMSFIAIDGGGRELKVQQIDGGEARPVTIPAGTIQSHLWSPNQSAYACLVRQEPGWTLQIVPALFGGDVPIQTVAMPQISRGAKLLRWIDRTIYLQIEDAGRRALTLQRVNLDSGSVERVDGPWKDMTVRGFDVRPDGQQVVWSAVANGTPRDDLWLADMNGGLSTPLTGADDESRKRFPLWNGPGTTVIYQSNRGLQVDLWELNVKTRKATRRTSDPGIERPESSALNGSLSYQLASERTALWIWDVREGKGSQVSDEGLSDFAPSTSQSAPFHVAFQRSQSSPVEGFLATDSDIFVSDVAENARAFVRSRKVGTGIGPLLSPDGKRLAYLRRAAEWSPVAQLLVRDLQTSGLGTVSSAAVLPSVRTFPVDLIEQTLTWTSPEDLYFVSRREGPDLSAVVHYHVGTSATDLVATETPNRMSDVHASPDGRTLTYLTRNGTAEVAPGIYQLHAVDLPTGADRVVRDLGSQYIVRMRGWLKNGAGVVLTRSAVFDRTDQTWTYDVLTVSRDGVLSRSGAIDHVTAVSRLEPRSSDLYVTRSLDGIENLFAYSLVTHKLRQVSENSVRGVTFGGVTPLGGDHVIGIRHEQTRDIHLLDTRPRRGQGAARQ